MTIIAKMNMILNGIESYEICQGNSLTNPKFGEADYVIANPPWNLDGYDERNLGQPSVRKIYTSLGINGFTPKNTADWAWIQLMLYFAKKKVGIVLDGGALFRGGREKRIRRAVVERDLIEAVILLPEKLFYNTGAPGVIIIFNKEKPQDRKNKILLINASTEFEQHPEVRRLNILGRNNIERIVNAYKSFKNEKGFCRVVALDEIRENDYNLNVTLYVMPIEDKESINVFQEFSELKRLEQERVKIMEEIEGYIEELKKV